MLRAGEIEVLAEARAIKRLGERITLLRRDITKSLVLAFEQGLPGPFEDYQLLLAPLLSPLRRIGADLAALERVAAALTDCAARRMKRSSKP